MKYFFYIIIYIHGYKNINYRNKKWKKIAFLCTGNSCRSQMAEGFAKHILKDYNTVVFSAGVQADALNQ